MEVREWLSSYDFPGDDLPMIRGAARPALDDPTNDDNNKCIDELMAACDEYIPEPPRETDKDFLMPVEDVFSIKGRGTVVTGRIEQGIVKVGDEIEIIGLGDDKKTTVTVSKCSKNHRRGRAGDNVGALLRGVEKDDSNVAKFFVPGTIKPHTKFL